MNDMNTEVKIAYLGNSVTAQRNSYVAPLHALLMENFTVAPRPIKSGLGGVGSIACAGLLNYLVLRHEPNICFIECSLSDSMGATPTQWVRESVEAIVADLLAVRVRPIFIHLQSFTNKTPTGEAVDRIYAEVAAKFHILVVDLRDFGDATNYIDDCHPDTRGSEKIAHEICARLVAEGSLNIQLESLICEVPRIRFLPATLNISGPVQCKPKHFKFALPFLEIPPDVPYFFERGESEFLGVYVIATDNSGVVNLSNVHGTIGVQIWDRWCHTPRIHFISLPEISAPCEKLCIELTKQSTGRRNAMGAKINVEHVGSRLDLVGAAVRIPAHGLSTFDDLNDLLWWV